ncbi:hypothetical protein ACTVZO_11070 [Streptomyces sp. IBSNAI002]|uniref:hypothetical protein n=1 Tax=Streptomyces sp. IBSNAI002 TaxID=3457500 RepID=UPI003FCF0F52
MPAYRPYCRECGARRTSRVHALGLCVDCATAPTGPPASDPGRRATELRDLLASARRPNDSTPPDRATS